MKRGTFNKTRKQGTEYKEDRVRRDGREKVRKRKDTNEVTGENENNRNQSGERRR